MLYLFDLSQKPEKKKKNTLPCQAVANNLFLEEVPKDISTLNILEKELICQRLLFKKIVIMPKGQFPKFRVN